jgi:hypothetical protein
MSQIEEVMPALSLATADVDSVKAFSSEFNVRKRMVPRLLVFTSRARQATIIKLKEEDGSDPDVVRVRSELEIALGETTKGDDGRFRKTTLALGAGKQEL